MFPYSQSIALSTSEEKKKSIFMQVGKWELYIEKKKKNLQRNMWSTHSYIASKNPKAANEQLL